MRLGERRSEEIRKGDMGIRDGIRRVDGRGKVKRTLRGWKRRGDRSWKR